MSTLIRKIEKNDLKKVIEMLSENISEFKPSPSEYENVWKSFNSQSNVFAYVALFENVVIGYGSIVVETKIRGGSIGHIEDIVVDINYRNQKVGKKILDKLFKIAQEHKCYKVVVQCKEHNIGFYENCGYASNGVAMQKFIK